MWRVCAVAVRRPGWVPSGGWGGTRRWTGDVSGVAGPEKEAEGHRRAEPATPPKNNRARGRERAVSNGGSEVRVARASGGAFGVAGDDECGVRCDGGAVFVRGDR